MMEKKNNIINHEVMTMTVATFTVSAAPQATWPKASPAGSNAQGTLNASTGFDQRLWATLEAMQIDPQGATTTFIHRLMQYNSWSEATSRAVYKEYLRFLYLAGTVGHAVTPSDTIDQAWHLHMIYTRHYWDELCGKILKRKLHHEPSAGGTAEDDKYDAQYVATLEAYRKAFGTEPPTDIWPRPKPPTMVKQFNGGPFALAAFGAFALTVMKILPVLVFFLVLAFIIAGGAVAYAMAPEVRQKKKDMGGGGCGAASSGGHSASSGGCGSSGGGDGGGGSCGGGD
ncbi:MAG: hypothetical protein RL291_1860 [Pseudomonadota bacterium]